MCNTSTVCVFSTDHAETDQRVFERQATTLSENGYDVTFVTCRPNDKELNRKNGVEIVVPEFVDSVLLDHLPVFISRILLAVLLTTTVMRRDGYDVYHFHDPELLPVVSVVALVSSGKFVYDVHDDASNSILEKKYLPDSLTLLASKLISLSDNICSRPMDGIICASDDISENFDHHGNVQVIANYPSKEWAKKEYPTDHDFDGLQLIYGGLLTRKRGILNLVEAVEQVPEDRDVRLVLCGWFRSSTIEDEVTERAEDSSRIVFRGYVPTEEVIRFYYESDAGVVCHLPSAKNQIYGVHRSNKLFQYMAAGLPVIVPDIGNWSELVTQHEFGLPVDSTDVDEIASTIERLIEKEDTRKTLGENARRAMCEYYNWELERETLLGFYERST